MNMKQPEAQERKFWKRLCALNRFSFFYMGGGVARASDKSGNWIEVHSAQEIVDDAECEVSTQHARITELESQLAQRFDAADMATASAQGFRDGVASLTVQAADSQPAQAMGATPPPCDQELFDQGVSVGLFDIPKWTAEALCRGIAAATEARVDWHYIGGRVHIKALPAARATAAQPGVVYAELPAPNYPKSGGFPGTFAEAQMRAFADATHALRASRGQAPAKPDPAYSAACHLATALFKKHFAHLPDFASGQAVWSLCDSTAGVISQIDNMVAGLVQPPTISPQADSVQEDAALWHWLAEYLVGTRTDLDDEIVASETVNDLRKLVEAAIKQGASRDR